MALTVQNDLGTVPNANGYIDLEYFQQYFQDRAIDISDFEDDQIKGAIVSATSYIDLKEFKGTKLEEDQTTEFPRDEMEDRYGNAVEGIPSNLKKATAEYARQACLNGGELAAAPTVAANGQQIQSFKEKVGPIEEETVYAANGSFMIFKPYPIADALIASFIQKFRNFIVYRG